MICMKIRKHRGFNRLIEQTEEQYNDQEEITEYIDFRKEMRNLLDASLKDALVLISNKLKIYVIKE